MGVLKEMGQKVLMGLLTVLIMVTGMTLLISLIMWSVSPIMGVLTFYEYKMGWFFFWILIFSGSMAGLMARKGERGPM